VLLPAKLHDLEDRLRRLRDGIERVLADGQETPRR
jgi:hypothetical protein